MNTIETFAALSGKLFMGGTYQSSEATQHFDVVEPATEECIGQIADATDAEVDAATDIALAAGRAWNAIDMRSRAVVMHEIAAVMRRDKDQFKRNVEASLRGRAVDGVAFERNVSIQG